MNRRRAFPTFALAACVALSGCVSENEAASVNGTMAVGGDDRNGPYTPVVDWWKSAPTFQRMADSREKSPWVSGASRPDPSEAPAGSPANSSVWD